MVSKPLNQELINAANDAQAAADRALDEHDLTDEQLSSARKIAELPANHWYSFQPYLGHFCAEQARYTQWGHGLRHPHPLTCEVGKVILSRNLDFGFLK